MSAFKADVIAPSDRLYEVRTNAFLYITPKHEERPIPQEMDSVLQDYGYYKPLAIGMRPWLEFSGERQAWATSQMGIGRGRLSLPTSDLR
jgi:hypothetical protein